LAGAGPGWIASIFWRRKHERVRNYLKTLGPHSF
jgi:hypothetical protein